MFGVCGYGIYMLIIVYCFYYDIGKGIDYILRWFLRVFKYW